MKAWTLDIKEKHGKEKVIPGMETTSYYWFNCFDNPKELQKFAGLALFENRSGKHKSEARISRRG